MSGAALAAAVHPAAQGSSAAPGPVFIGGLAGSGKTPLRLLLDACPGLVLTRRTYFWTRVYGRYGDLRDAHSFERCLRALLAHEGTQALQPDAARIRRAFEQGERSYARLFALLHEQHAERKGKRRWGSQEGFVERHAAAIFAAHPAARMVHMVRDPRGWYAATTPPARRLPGRLGWALARWLHSARLALHNRELYPGRYMLVPYERLIAEPRQTLEAVCDFIGEVAPVGARPGQPGETMGRGAPLNAREVWSVQSAARAEMMALGYEPVPLALPPLGRLCARAIDWPANRAGLAAWRLYSANARAGAG